MRSVLLGAIAVLVPSSAIGGSFFCNDACTIDPPSGESCSSLGMGCNPILHVCVPVCENDSHCQPGGSCMDGECVGVVCAPAADAGSDAGPSEDAAMNDGASPDDAAIEDATALDGGDDLDAGDDAGDVGPPIDAAFPDAMEPMLLGGGPGANRPRNETRVDDCGCSTTASHGRTSVWIAFTLLFGLRNLPCKRKR